MAVLTASLGSPSMLGHHHDVPHEGCAAMKTRALSGTRFSFTCFPSLAGCIFKGHAGTE